MMHIVRLTFCLLLWTPLSTAAKKLVVFAGPHETGGGAVNQFLATHASSTSGNSSALYGWTWPTVEESEDGDIVASPHHLFDLLVEEQDNDAIRSMLLTTIGTAMENSDNGVIIGSLLLDRVGLNPETSYDAVRALGAVVASLGIPPEDVVVAVTYRTPRIDQWAAVFANHFDFELYEDFLCSEDSHIKDRRWEWLDTCMNPFFVAKAYYDVGYQILMIDQAGTAKAGKDIAHVLACHVMDGQNCNDDWLIGLEDDTVDVPPTISINELGETRSSNLEQLFLSRDCYFMTQLEGLSRFQILNSEITECQLSLQSYYEQFADSDFLLNAIQSQKGCQTADVDVPALLAQKDDMQSNNDNKKLVIFVGPHETQAEEVMRFFSHYASTNEEASLSPSFNGWLWPDIQIDVEAGSANYRIFDVLVEQTDAQVEAAVLDGILENWHLANKGLVLGSLLFDAVDSTPYSGYDGLAAVQRVVDKLNISKSHVAIVLSYRVPRIDHWGVAWSKHFKGSTYTDFVCSDEHKDKRWEWLNTVMNPFQIAKSYFDAEYKVVVMDQTGISDAGLDISHAIACEILEGILCEDGFVRGLSHVATDPVPSFEINTLSEQDQADLEAMFFGRDCYYSNILPGSHRFHILNDHGAWEECNEGMENVYQALADTDVFMNAIQAQQGCEEFDVDIPSLVGRDTDTSTEAEDTGGSSNNGDNNTNDAATGKKLFILAGPHETTASDVARFFSRFASPNSSDFSDSFNGWMWPTVDTESLGHTVPPHRVFDVMVKAEVEPEIQEFFIRSIKNSFSTAENGVIIGALDFDRTGLNPYSGYDPLGVVRRLTAALGISDDDVIIAIDYRAPRIDHWGAIWSQHFGDFSYEDFLCSDDEQLKLKRWEYVDTVVNPMKIAAAYAEQGWNVVVVDYDGTHHAGRDVAHVLACEVLQGVDCEDGWITDLKEQRIAAPEIYQIDELRYTERNELEQAFLFRDCYYKNGLEDNPGFDVYYQRKLWDACTSEKEYLYEQLESTDLFLALLQSQQPCGSSSVSLSQILAGVDHSTSGGSSTDLAGLAIAVAVMAVLVIVMAFYLSVRRSRAAQKALHDAPPDGVFRDHPSNGGRVGPYRDDSDGKVPDRPYSVQHSIAYVEGLSIPTFVRGIRTSLQGTATGPNAIVRVGPYREESNGRIRERAYSDEEEEHGQQLERAVVEPSSGHRSSLNDDILLKLDRNENSEHSGFEV